MRRNQYLITRIRTSILYYVHNLCGYPIVLSGIFKVSLIEHVNIAMSV